MTIGASTAKTFWTEFPRAPTGRGLGGVKLVISDAHEGLEAAARVLNATWQHQQGNYPSKRRRTKSRLWTISLVVGMFVPRSVWRSTNDGKR